MICVSAVLICGFLCGCAETTKFFSKQPAIPTGAPVAEAGQDLHVAVAKATQAYIDIKNGDANFAWSVKQGLDAYQLFLKSKADVKQLVQQWSDGTAAGKSFAEKLSALFQASTGTPEQKAAALASGVQTAAQNSGP